MQKRAARIAATTIVAALALGTVAFVAPAVIGGQEPPAAAQPTPTAVTVDLTAIPYTNGLATEQEAEAAVAERARIEAEAAEAARLAAEAAAAQAAADEAARLAAEQLAAEQLAAEQAAWEESAYEETEPAPPVADPCIVIVDAEGNYYPCGCRDLSCSYR
ncbi:hypothetical protein [Agromyces sp. NPDC058110]|uniref:hypothetical protein n=1 Tax=Agromyces sp. NPDC058110 TaxID=3346345 RepID=UPI0036DD2ADC